MFFLGIAVASLIVGIPVAVVRPVRKGTESWLDLADERQETGPLFHALGEAELVDQVEDGVDEAIQCLC